MPYAFHLVPKGEATTARLAIHESIMADALNPAASSSTAPSFSPEDVFELWCEPQAVFRVRGVGRCSATLSGHGSPILCCAQSPTGRFAATGSGDATARIWDMDSESPKHTLTGHKGWVLCVEWDAREKILATGGHDGQIRLWDPKTGAAAGQPLLGHSKWITSLAFEPLHLAKGTTQRLASASKDGTVRIWNTSTRKVECVLTGHAASVNVVRWGGENVIYTGSSDRTVKVWSGVDVSFTCFSETDSRENSFVRSQSTRIGSTLWRSAPTLYCGPVLSTTLENLQQRMTRVGYRASHC